MAYIIRTQELHHIKKENIGLIEVMGLAVLPARLKDEMAALETAILEEKDLRADETLAEACGLGRGISAEI